MRPSTAIAAACAMIFAAVHCGCGEPSPGDSAGSPIEGTEGTPLDLANASRHYLMKCSVCHGEDGAPVLTNAPDLRTSTMTLDERVAIIAYGKGTMPPHRSMLDKATIRDIAVYIEKFRH